MGSILDSARLTYAAGTAGSPKQPVKAEIIGIFALIEAILGTAVNGLVVGNAVVYQTRALLYAAAARPSGSLAVVYGDGTAAYNGIYVTNGGTGAAAWTLTSLVLPASFATELAAARGIYSALGDRLNDYAPGIAGIFDDMTTEPQFQNGAVSLRGAGNRELGATIPNGQTGRNTVLLGNIAIDPITAGELSARTIRMTFAFSTSATFTRSPSPGVNVVKQDGSTAGLTASVVSSSQVGARLIIVVETSITADVAVIQPYVALTATAATTSDEAIVLTGFVLAVAQTNSDTTNVERENAERSRRTSMLAATGDFGPVSSDLVSIGTPANGATRRYADDGVNVIGWTIPTGSTGQNSFVQDELRLSSDESALLSGATVEWAWKLEHLTNYTRAMTGTMVVDGTILATTTTRKQQVGPNETILSVQAVLPSNPTRLMPFFQSTGAAASAAGEWIQRKGVSVKVVASADSIRTPARLTAHIAEIRNRNKAMAALTMATVGDDIRPTGYDLAVAATDTIATRIAVNPLPTIERRRRLNIARGVYAQSGVYPQHFDALVGRGTGQTVIDGSQPANSDLTVISALSAIEAYRDADYANMTVIARNMRYAVHSDSASEVRNVRQRYRCMEIIHQGNDDAVAYQTSSGGNPSGVWSTTHAFGGGLWSGWNTSIADSRLVGHRAAAAFHNNKDFATAARVTVENSQLLATKAGGFSFEATNMGAMINSRIDLVGNSLSGDINYQTDWLQTDLALMPANHAEMEIHGHGNTPAVFLVTDPGRALKIESAATSGTSTIAVSGNAVDALFGRVIALAGAGGIKGYAYGWFDCAGKLGQRLGNCTSVNKTLTISVNGGSAVNVVFNADYTSSSDAAILAMINGVLGSTATASLYAIGERYRPAFTDEERLLINLSAVGIPMGSACAYTSDRAIRLMTNADPVEIFAGIAWEDIYPAGYGRVKTRGYLPLTDIQRSDAAALVYGDALSIGATAGKLTKSTAAPLMFALRADAVRF